MRNISVHDVNCGVSKEFSVGINGSVMYGGNFWCPSTFPAMNSISINPRGVYKALSNLQTHKTTGPDAISARFLKELATKITPPLIFFLPNITVDECQRTGRWSTLPPPPLRKESRVQRPTIVRYPSHGDLLQDP